MNLYPMHIQVFWLSSYTPALLAAVTVLIHNVTIQLRHFLHAPIIDLRQSHVNLANLIEA